MDEWEEVPCKCGIKERKDGDWEHFYLKMVTDDSPAQVPPRKTCRCKTCKDVLLIQRVVKNDH